MNTGRLIISGHSLGVGKTYICLGIAALLKSIGKSVSVVSHGPEFVPAVIYQRTTRRRTRFVDSSIHSEKDIKSIFRSASSGADIVLIDGYDEFTASYTDSAKVDSDAYLASMTKTPVLYMVSHRDFSHCTSMSRLAAEVIQNIQVNLEDLAIPTEEWPQLAGIVINNADQTLVEEFKALPESTESLVVGCIPEIESISPVVSNSLSGCIVAEGKDISLPSDYLDPMVSAVRNYCNIPLIVSRATAAEDLGRSTVMPKVPNSRIAVAWDSCFCIGFQDNIDTLAEYGAEVVTFSPLADIKLPSDIGAIYLPGAIPSKLAEANSVSESMRNAIKKFYASGGFIYSEGGSTAFLCEQFSVRGDPLLDSKNSVQDGLGLIPGFADTGNLLFNYIELGILEDLYSELVAGSYIRGVDTGEWQIKLLRLDEVSRTISAEFAGVAEIIKRSVGPSFKDFGYSVEKPLVKPRARSSTSSGLSLTAKANTKGVSRGSSWGEIIAVSPNLLSSFTYNHLLTSPDFLNALINRAVQR